MATSLERTISNKDNDYTVELLLTLHNVDNEVPDKTEEITLDGKGGNVREYKPTPDNWALSRIQVLNKNNVYEDYTLGQPIEIEDNGPHNVWVKNVVHHSGQYSNFIKSATIDDQQ
jgi:hypothetical protein